MQEIEGDRRLHRESIQVPDPPVIDASRHVASKGGVDVSIGQYEGTGLERRDDVLFGAVGEVGGVNQAERHRRQHALLLAPPGHVTNERRRIPFAEKRPVPCRFQPFLEQGQLRALAGPVDALNDEETSRNAMLAIDLHRSNHGHHLS
jgi:hypothetical protein